MENKARLFTWQEIRECLALSLCNAGEGLGFKESKRFFFDVNKWLQHEIKLDEERFSSIDVKMCIVFRVGGSVGMYRSIGIRGNTCLSVEGELDLCSASGLRGRA